MVTDDDYTGEVTPGGARRRPRARPPDDHQGRRRPRDVQQLLPAALPRRPTSRAHRRRRRARARCSSSIGDGGLATRSSRPTSTGTTTARSPRWWPRTGRDGGRRRARRRRDRRSRPASTVDRRVGDGDTVAVGTCDLEVIHLAGHTPGSIALLLRRPRRPPRTCSPATRCSPAVSATRSATPTPSPS